MTPIEASNCSAAKSALELLASRFTGLDAHVEIKIPGLEDLDGLDWSNPDPTSGIGLTANLAERLIETGLFEIRAYAREPKAKWNPLEERFDTWSRNHNKVGVYQAQFSTPDLYQVKHWLDGFFK